MSEGILQKHVSGSHMPIPYLKLELVLQFTQKKADGEIRWAILSVVTLLRRHSKTHKQLAKAMAAGKSVTECLAIIESNFAKESAQEPQIA